MMGLPFGPCKVYMVKRGAPPGAAEGWNSSMLLPAPLEDTFQGFHGLQESHDDSDVVP